MAIRSNSPEKVESDRQAAAASREAARASGARPDIDPWEGVPGMGVTPPPEDRDVPPPPKPSPPTPKPPVVEDRDVPPPPKAPPPAAVPFKAPEGAVIVERDAKGRPTVLETKEGERVYTPESTMYKIGYETHSEYIEAQRGRRVEVAPGKVKWEYGPKHIAIRTHTGELAHITQAQAKTLAVAKGKDQFRHMIRLGLIPSGSLYVPPEKKGEPWSYIPKARLDAFQVAMEAKAEAQALTTAARREMERRWADTPILEAKALAEEAKRKRVRRTAREVAAEVIAEAKFLTIEASKEVVPPIPEIPEKPMHLQTRAERLATAERRFENIKKELRFSDEDIESARAGFLEASGTYSEKKIEKIGDFDWSHFWKTPEKLTSEQKKQIALWEGEIRRIEALPLHKQELELAKMRAKVGAEAFGQAAAVIFPTIMQKLKKEGKDLPQPLKFFTEAVAAVAVGAIIGVPLFTGYMVTTLAQTPFVPRKGEYLREVGSGIASWLVTIPATIAAEPALAGGFYTGLFIVGPKGVKDFVIETGAKTSPFYIPKRGMSIEYSVSRVPTKIGTEATVRTAVNKGITQALQDPKGMAGVPIGNGRLELRIRSTPVAETLGGALYNARPDITPALLRGEIKGTVWTSPQLAPRFADSSASGRPSTRPSVMMIFPKTGNKVKWSVTDVFYRGTKEIEAIYEATKLIRIKSLRSRIFGAKAGDFITTHNGKVIPIYRYAEPGAVAPMFGLPELVAIRLRTIQASIADLVKGRKGYEIIKPESLEVMRRRVNKGVKAEVAKGKAIDKASDIVLRRELERIYNRRLERLFRARPEAFERQYMTYLDRAFREVLPRVRRTPLRMPREPRRIPRELREPLRAPRELRVPPRVPREPREPPRVPRELRVVREPRVPPREPLRVPRELRVVREPRVPPREPPPIEPPPPRVPPPFLRGLPDKEKRKHIKKSKGAIAFNMGEVGAKPTKKRVWHTLVHPFTSRDYVTVIGKAPRGATILVEGENSAYRTAQLLYGKAPSRRISMDIGFMDAVITASGRKINLNFAPDPKGLTTGDITIGRRAPPITERSPRLTNRGNMRITPKRPALRR